MVKYKRLIFVCTGNTCRSPMAQRIFQRLDDVTGLEVLSRGLVVLFPEPANAKACVVMKNHELSLEEHIALGLSESDITEDTLILTMTEKQKNTVLEEYKEAHHVYTMKEYVGQEGDVIDPYGGTLLEYEDCYLELSKLVKKTLYRLIEEE